LVTHKVELFPSLIHVVSEFLSQQQCEDIIEYAKTLKNEVHDAIPENGISNHNLKYSFLEEVQKNVLSCTFINRAIQEKIDEYSESVGYSSLRISNSWINFQYPDSQLMRHTHPDSQISAVLYLKADENSSKIYFYNPNPYVFFTAHKEFTKYSFHKQWFRAIPGDLILFPSWMAHGSDGEKNQSDERVAVSFNTSLK
jgi:uncharacterized protein (TIGR02466 family)